MRKRLWTTPQAAAGVLADTGKSEFILFYELAPTGLVHAGILRTLLRVQGVKTELAKLGLRGRFILGLSDRTALKAFGYLAGGEAYIGRQLKNVPSPGSETGSYFDWSRADILRAVAEYGIGVDDLLYDDEFYESHEFRRLTESALLKKGDALQILSRSQKTPPRIFHPVCLNCGKMYQCAVSDVNLCGEGRYRCHNCGFSSDFSIYTDGGLLPFKLELAIKWKWLGVDLHFTGIDHLPAVQTGEEVHELLFRGSRINFYFLNLTLQEGRGVGHKSLGNFSAVTRLAATEKARMREKLMKTPDRILLRLPAALGAE